MLRFTLSLLLAASVAIPAYADVTMRTSVTGSGMGQKGTTKGVTYIKGNKMRTDLQIGNRTQTTIFDLDAQKMISFESGKKEADVWDMAELNKQIAGNVDASAMKASIKPNGQTKQFGTSTAQGYDMAIELPASMGGDKNMTFTVTLAGPVWIVKNAPGTADYINFYKAAIEKGWIFSDPRAAKAQPGQAKAMSEMYRQFAALGGIAYESSVEIKMGGGGGPLGGLMARMGNMRSDTLVEDIQTTALGDDLFAPPPGTKLNARR